MFGFFVSFFCGLQQFISFGHRRHRALPEHFLHHIKGPLFLPCHVLANAFSPSSQLMVKLLPQPLGASTLPWHVHLLTVCSSHILCKDICMRPQPTPCGASQLPLLFATKVHFSCVLGLSTPQSCHSSTKQSKPAAYRNAVLTSCLFC